MDTRKGAIFYFKPEIPSLGKFGPKNQNCHFKLEFNSLVHVFCSRPEIPFLDKFGPTNQNCQSNPKFGTQTNSNMQNSMVMFKFFIFDWKYSFWLNLVQKVKTVSLS